MTYAPAPRRSRLPHLSRAYRRVSRVAAAIAVVSGVAMASAAGCGIENGIVGGQCATGWTQCGLACVDIENDPDNCGACGHVCPPGVACSGGVCSGLLEGGELNDGALPDGEYYLNDGGIAYCDPDSDSIECHRHD